MTDILTAAAQEIVSNVMSEDDRRDIVENPEKWVEGMQNQIDYATGWEGIENHTGRELVDRILEILGEPVYATIAEIEDGWGSNAGEWGILGPKPTQDEEVRFVHNPVTGKWRMERQLDDGSECLTGIWYVALEHDLNAEDVAGF